VSEVKRGRGRPPIEVKNPLDLLNLRETKTQHCKSVKLKESTYNVLCDLRDGDPSMKTIDDVVMQGLAALALASVGND